MLSTSQREIITRVLECPSPPTTIFEKLGLKLGNQMQFKCGSEQNTVMCMSERGFGLDIGFIDHLQTVTTNNYNTIAISTFYKIMPSLFQPAVSSLVVAW
jgi:carboxypeptidase C (cathepsin A)